MPHRLDTWTDAIFIYPLYYVNFLTSFMEWFRLFFFNGVTVKTENSYSGIHVRSIERNQSASFIRWNDSRFN